MAVYADIHGYVTFPFGVEPSKVFVALENDSRFKVVESEAHESFQYLYAPFSGEARLSGSSDDQAWLESIESRLAEIDFFSLVLFVSYENSPTLLFSYFKIGQILKSVGRLSEETISETHTERLCKTPRSGFDAK
ncbi:hypothetical protein [Roseateles depolymerans]|uniref:hypothetical protein n=1 Tax=Roseateles depolymerans TaxID=76731 RepID=UPI0011C05BA2|nr:hypothetical protein [Roseateles depolymerans]